MAAGRTLDDLDADARQAFFDLADQFIRGANDAAGAEPPAWVGAALLWACARYNGFAMQAQGQPPAEVDAETVDYLAGEFEGALRRHMEQALVAGTPGRPDPRTLEAVVSDVLADRGMDEPAREAFFDLADAMIDRANALVRTAPPSRVSAAFMYAAARFAAYVLQAGGAPAGPLGEDRLAALGGAYRAALRHHLAEALVRPQA